MKLIKLARHFFLLTVFLPSIVCSTNSHKKQIQNRPPLSKEVVFASNTIRIPIGYFLLARQHSERCAVKLLDYWTGESSSEQFAVYDSYFSKDSVSSITPTSANYFRGELSFPKLVGIGRLSFNFGDQDIQCGNLRLSWSGSSWIYFYDDETERGDNSMELAPTPWTDISEVNFNDPRLQWYRYDLNREESYVNIDHLWDKDPARNPEPDVPRVTKPE